MSGPQTPEPARRTQGDSPTGTGGEDTADGIQHSQRMLSFSDALLSIIATVMILPVTHTEISPEQVLGNRGLRASRFDKSIQRLLATRIAVYLMTFLIVTVAWAAHTRLFQVVGKIDDTLALLNLACMMTITFLPFTFSLMVTFPEVPLGIFLFCMCVIAIGAVQALIVVYAFHFPHLLNPQIESSTHRTLYRQHILGIVLRGPALCFAAAGFSLFFYPLIGIPPPLWLPPADPAGPAHRLASSHLLHTREARPSVCLLSDVVGAVNRSVVLAFVIGLQCATVSLIVLPTSGDPEVLGLQDRRGGGPPLSAGLEWGSGGRRRRLTAGVSAVWVPQPQGEQSPRGTCQCAPALRARAARAQNTLPGPTAFLVQITGCVCSEAHATVSCKHHPAATMECTSRAAATSTSFWNVSLTPPAAWKPPVDFPSLSVDLPVLGDLCKWNPKTRGFYVWLLSFNVTFSRLVHVAPSVRTSSCWLDHVFSPARLSTDSGFLLVLADVNSAAVNVGCTHLLETLLSVLLGAHPGQTWAYWMAGGGRRGLAGWQGEAGLGLLDRRGRRAWACWVTGGGRCGLTGWQGEAGVGLLDRRGRRAWAYRITGAPFDFGGTCHIVFHGGCTSLRPHRQSAGSQFPHTLTKARGPAFRRAVSPGV
ncbi:endosomal/lysosomal potassium channel TMEM175 isoform X1 [Leopardus geoffroyi]|uniref:endosomal/lysosomal potassium channel TMEM175 isoform X1 n=1 Tax=Leopardus geoffroyi TaxID=46844 RepID=UPI001E26327B|nr:endosomal/lysosomal potassium channel TMEM175 isoform X1 [Leopardus geoffroyi]